MTDPKIVRDFPPNFEDISEAFELSGKEIFAFGNVIYNPTGKPISAVLKAHEQVHFEQQGDKPLAWWDRYITDEKFRLEQELEAHRVEYRMFCQMNKDRNKRNMYLQRIAGRLSSKMYGELLLRAEAVKRIRS